MKKKIILGATIVFVLSAVVGVGVVRATNKQNTAGTQCENELFPTQTIDGVQEGENLYVDLNNKFVEVMNAYENGNISEEEYKKICADIQEQIQKHGLDTLQEAEKDYKK